MHDINAEMDASPKVLEAIHQFDCIRARLLALEGEYVDAQRAESRARQSRLQGRKVADSAIATATASTLDIQHDLRACQDALDSASLAVTKARQEWINAQVETVKLDLAELDLAERSRIDAVGEALADLYKAMASDGVNVREDVSGDPYGALTLALSTLGRRVNRYTESFALNLGEVAGLSVPHQNALKARRGLDERLGLLSKMRANERTTS